jgi:hypothetical protein|tara:strand:+ start:1227 stop:1484 length:258 start_codon:yes stop_codon:yes gene_type:complete
MEPNIIDMLATDASSSEVSDAIKASLFAKSVEKIDALRPAVANSLLSFDDEVEDDTEEPESNLESESEDESEDEVEDQEEEEEVS